MAPDTLPRLTPEAYTAVRDLLSWMQQVSACVAEMRPAEPARAQRYSALSEAGTWLNAVAALSGNASPAAHPQHRPLAGRETPQRFHMTLIQGGKA